MWVDREALLEKKIYMAILGVRYGHNSVKSETNTIMALIKERDKVRDEEVRCEFLDDMAVA